MGSGGSAVDAMVIGCLGVKRPFFSYLAILISDFVLSLFSIIEAGFSCGNIFGKQIGNVFDCFHHLF